MQLQQRPQNEAKEHKLLPAKTMTAYLLAIIDFGTQPWSAQYPDPKRKICFYFEFPTETIEYNWEMKPMVSNTIMNKLAWTEEKPSNLRNLLSSMTGKAMKDNVLYSFKMEDLIWLPYTVSIKHDTSKDWRVYANISSVSPAMEWIVIPPLQWKTFIFDMDKSLDNFEAMPKWMQDKVSASPEYKNFNSTINDLPF